ncbi:MAG: phosphoribosylanthranilate isomerase [Lentisphaerae bacterium]|jgi:phosphoribosylanthranilate isomerase|nr:phosphoribosylanthranilate isomerase [Lentisphaerota bacterium]
MSISAIENAKICGIKDSATAELCAELGFGAVGFVFYERSPRNISPETAAEICSSLPHEIAKVGVFVDRRIDEMLQIAKFSGLTSVQLHGSESVETAMAISSAGFRVIKAVRGISEIEMLPAGISVLMECGHGMLPGGNAAEWNWADAQKAAMFNVPLGIAGGLHARNIKQAMRKAAADACDISSGAESAPGTKDHNAIKNIALEVKKLPNKRRIFWR